VQQQKNDSASAGNTDAFYALDPKDGFFPSLRANGFMR